MSFISGAYVISMYHNKWRWDTFLKNISDDRLKRYRGVDTRTQFKAGKWLAKTGFELCPDSVETNLYFSQGPGAVGCYLAHVNVWSRIIKEGHEWTLIIEDDADVNDIKQVLNVNPAHHRGFFGDYMNYDLIQLNRRTQTVEQFNGTEAYLISLNGAKTLHKLATDDKVIITAVDKWIGYQCESQLRATIKPRVGLNHYTSDIIIEEDKYWMMNDSELQEFKQTDDYKWWL